MEKFSKFCIYQEIFGGNLAIFKIFRDTYPPPTDPSITRQSNIRHALLFDFGVNNRLIRLLANLDKMVKLLTFSLLKIG